MSRNSKVSDATFSSDYLSALAMEHFFSGSDKITYTCYFVAIAELERQDGLDNFLENFHKSSGETAIPTGSRPLQQASNPSAVHCNFSAALIGAPLNACGRKQ